MSSRVIFVLEPKTCVNSQERRRGLGDILYLCHQLHSEDSRQQDESSIHILHKVKQFPSFHEMLITAALFVLNLNLHDTQHGISNCSQATGAYTLVMLTKTNLQIKQATIVTNLQHTTMTFFFL